MPADRIWEWDLKNSTRMGEYITNVESQIILDGLAKLDSPSILDIGAGSGRITTCVLKHGYQKIIGIDKGMMQLQNFRANTQGTVPALLADAVALPFGAVSFDVLLAIQMVDNLPSVQEFLQECYRIMKPGGYLFLNFSNRNSPFSLPYKLFIKNINFYKLTLAEINRMSRSIGFEIEKACGFRWLPFSRGSNNILIPLLTALEKWMKPLIPAELSPWIFLILTKRR